MIDDDHVLAEALGDSYEGGPIICLDLGAIARVAPGQQFEPKVRQVFLHELGHCLPAALEPIVDLPHTPAILNYQRHQWAKEWATSPEPGCARDPHGAQFCRVVLHLYYRALVAGLVVPLAGLLATGNPMQSVESHYLATLLGELIAMRGQTFAEIVAAEPPAEFTRLCEADAELYRRYFSAKVKTL